MVGWAQTETPTSILISDRRIISPNVLAVPTANNSADIFSALTYWYSPGKLSRVQLSQYIPVMTGRFCIIPRVFPEQCILAVTCLFLQILLPKGVIENCAEMYLVGFLLYAAESNRKTTKIFFLLVCEYQIASQKSRHVFWGKKHDWIQ